MSTELTLDSALMESLKSDYQLAFTTIVRETGDVSCESLLELDRIIDLPADERHAALQKAVEGLEKVASKSKEESSNTVYI